MLFTVDLDVNGYISKQDIFYTIFRYYWLIPESPRWLVGRGRIADAEKVFRNLAKKNGIKLEYGFLLELHVSIRNNKIIEIFI